MQFTDLKAQYRALKQDIDARIQRVLEHGQYILGPEVQEMEEKLAAWTGAKHCVSVASGTEALLISLMALDIKPGDEVITVPFTFVATAEVIVLAGAKPVFVDVEEDTANMDAAKLEAAITPRTRAIMPVALYGQPADMDEINAIAARHRLPVIEDAAQSFGAAYKGRKSCHLSTIGCTSFFPSKPLGCYGDGGAIFTDDDTLATAMREIRVHGQSGRYHHPRIGLGGRMDSIQCAVVLGKLGRFEWEIERRIALGRRYDSLLAGLSPRLRPVRVKPERTSVYGQYTVRTSERTAIQEALKAKGIPTAVHYPTSLHQQPAYAAG
jgi:UDP-2-acetamido-2-deoxy-ribo-hexuluronate aminotransferase